LGLFRRGVPRALRPALGRDERVLAWATTGDDTAVVVTTLGVWLPGQDRLGWHQIHKAAWAAGALTVTPAVLVRETPTYAVMADGPQVRTMLGAPGDVPVEIRNRVTRSVGYTAHFEVPGGGVRVVGRRTPGVNGLSWHVRYDDGTDDADPQVVAATDELVATASAPPPEDEA
jgi:hypothetical protein